ncbi:hypothetical protein P8452_61261 [Trifolium repens]|nr:hypothetical protein P8452_61261 [Trifolium repens]
MSGSSAVLGHPNATPNSNPKKSKDEEDLQERSTKKMKTQDQEGATDRSYRDTILGRRGGMETEEGSDADEIESEGEQGEVLGSRFVTLSDDHIEINQEDMEREGAKEVNDTEGENHGENFQRLHEENMHQLRNKKGTNKGGGKLGEGIKEKVNKDPKLAARGGGFKSKNVAQLKKGVENIAGNIGSKRLDNLKVQYEKPKMTHMATTNKSELQKGSMGEVAENVGPCVENILGLEEIISPNIPRPPNMSTTPLIISNTHSDVDMGLENEIFEDAHDQGSVGTNDSDTEVVRETLGFDQ